MEVKVYNKLGREFSKNCKNPIKIIVDGKEKYIACCKCDDCKKGQEELGYGVQRRNDKN